jgi:site-specific DNA-methyltransferase (adenine-specific)
MLKPYFKKDNFTLYLGNCLELLKEFPENHFDMIFADPPYHLSNGGITVHAGKMTSVNKGQWDKSNGIKEDYLFHENWLKECKRVLKPDGTIWVSGTYHSIYACGLALQKLGYHILNDICWYKSNASPNISCRYFTASHETLIWARKDKKARHKFNYKIAKEGDWLEDSYKKPNKQMRSVWEIGTPKASEKKFGKHPTQKPLELLKRIILTSTDKNDLVLDPFTGSSTTGIAAYLYERKFVGIDKDKGYLDLSIKRFEDIQKQPQLRLHHEKLLRSPQKKCLSQQEKLQTAFY